MIGLARSVNYSGTFANLPPASGRVGVAFVSDIGAHGSFWYSDGSTWGLVNGSMVLAQSAVAVSVSASTVEEVLFSYTMPAGLMGINGALRISALFSLTNNANVKTPRFRLGATALTGSAWSASIQTGSASLEAIPQTIRNRGAANSQIVFVAANGHTGASSGTASTAFTEDTSVATVVSITGQKAVAGDTLTLEGFTLELLRP